MKKTIILFMLSAVLIPLFGQEILKSMEEEYMDLLALYGTTERSYLSYRTLSDSVWNFSNDEKIESLKNNENPDPSCHPWNYYERLNSKILWQPENINENFFTKGLFQGLRLKNYGPSLYSSVNSAAPFGQNDGALWQGKGLNTSLSLGTRLEGYGFEFTFLPQLCFSQNQEFSFKTPEGFNSPTYAGKAKKYGYCYGTSIDAVQRFGEDAFFTFDFGDTELRWSWYAFTLGIGWQSIWLGPNHVNALLHSNNAASYPKIDFGIRKQEITIPFLNWNLGYIEGRIWTGLLTESEYFDNDESNDHRLFHGLSLSYSPSFMPGFTINANRACIVSASWENMSYIIPAYTNTHVGEHDGSGEDQKMSITADWLFDKVGFEIYGEIGIDDFLPSGESIIQGYIRWPFHTACYAVGARKAFNHKNPDIKSELLFEWDNSEPSQDYQFWAQYNFGHHYQLLQGYTNKGQFLGNGYGYGGNSQHLEYRLYYPKGTTSFIIGRNNPDNSYIYGKAVFNSAVDSNGNYMLSAKYLTAFKANFYIGADTKYIANKNIVLGTGLFYHLIINPEYNPEKDSSGRYRINTLLHNIHFRFTAQYNL